MPPPGLPLPEALDQALADHLAFLYGSRRLPDLLSRLRKLIADNLRPPIPPPSGAGPLTEQDVFLITYPDQIRSPDEPPLRTLLRWLDARLAGAVSGIHLLPFFPYSSDDGFSVVDYRQVRPDLGSWDDVTDIARHYRLMVDAVINHVSIESAWFKGYLAGEPRFQDFFLTIDPDADLSAVVRPRNLPLRTRFAAPEGPRDLWTTFSADQIDLNYANPEVLFAVLEVLLDYVRRGAQLLRLDAVAFLWKEVGTTCIHLPQTHRIVKLIRLVLEAVAPWVSVITETNVPQDENLSYFGDGSDEAHLVYQFALPPLTLHTFLKGDATRLTAWAAGLRLPSDQVTFLNFLASHDGIGLRAVYGILTPKEIDALVREVLARGGRVSYRATGGAGREPYELNLTYFDALNHPQEVEQDVDRAVARFLASQAVLLCLAGIPAVYFHSLLGSRSDVAGFERTAQPRSLNRQKLPQAGLEAVLADAHSLASRVFTGCAHLLRLRRAHPAFHPGGSQQVLDLGPAVVAVLRTSPEANECLLCLQRVSGDPPQLGLRLSLPPSQEATDLVSGEKVRLSHVPLGPYQVRWMRLDQA
jgi:sucrose phosphorylase